MRRCYLDRYCWQQLSSFGLLLYYIIRVWSVIQYVKFAYFCYWLIPNQRTQRRGNDLVVYLIQLSIRKVGCSEITSYNYISCMVLLYCCAKCMGDQLFSFMQVICFIPWTWPCPSDIKILWKEVSNNRDKYLLQS